MNWNSVRWGKHILYWAEYSNQGRTKIFCTGTMNQQRKDPFHLYSLSPHSHPFQVLARATPLYSLSGFNAIVFTSCSVLEIHNPTLPSFLIRFSSFLIFSIPLNNYDLKKRYSLLEDFNRISKFCDIFISCIVHRSIWFEEGRRKRYVTGSTIIYTWNLPRFDSLHCRKRKMD